MAFLKIGREVSQRIKPTENVSLAFFLTEKLYHSSGFADQSVSRKQSLKYSFSFKINIRWNKI